MLAVVIPTWNADQTLVGTVESIRRECAQSGGQIVVSDGGSSDASRELANAAGADVVVGQIGRAHV